MTCPFNIDQELQVWNKGKYHPGKVLRIEKKESRYLLHVETEGKVRLFKKSYKDNLWHEGKYDKSGRAREDFIMFAEYGARIKEK